MSRWAGVLLVTLACGMAVAGPAAAAPPVNSTPPAISGTPAVGQTLTASGDSWDGTQTGVGYQWRRCVDAGATDCSDIPAATNADYTVVTDDVGRFLLARATASNAQGETTAVDSAPTAQVPQEPPVNTAVPEIRGTPRSGRTLTAVDGAWTGTSPTITRQWLRCDDTGSACANIPGAAAPTLLLGSDDLGHTIRVRETATNAAGGASADSAPTAVVPIPVALISFPMIAGSPVPGATLVSSVGDWSGTPPITLTRRWQRCTTDGSTCTDIPNALSDTYTVQGADLGSNIRMVVFAFNGGGGAAAGSSMLGPVTTGAPGPLPPTPAAPVTPVLTPPATLAAAFNMPRKANLTKALAGKLKVRAECTGPCRLTARLKGSKAVARKWKVPRTLAKASRDLAAKGATTLRPRFAKKTQVRLRSVKRLVGMLTVEARDGDGELMSRRSSKLTLTR